MQSPPAKIVMALCVIVLAAFVLPATANTTTNWTFTTGDWFTPSHWDNGLPDLTNGAQINNGGTAQIMSGSAVADYVTLGFNGSDSGTLSVSGVGTMLTTNNRSLDVGADGTGTVNITGGAVEQGSLGFMIMILIDLDPDLAHE